MQPSLHSEEVSDKDFQILYWLFFIQSLKSTQGPQDSALSAIMYPRSSLPCNREQPDSDLVL